MDDPWEELLVDGQLGSWLVKYVLTSGVLSPGKTISMSSSTNPCCSLNNVVNRSARLLYCNASYPMSETILGTQPGVLS